MKLYHCVSLLRDSCGAVSMSWNWAATQEHVDVWKKSYHLAFMRLKGCVKKQTQYCTLNTACWDGFPQSQTTEGLAGSSQKSTQNALVCTQDGWPSHIQWKDHWKDLSLQDQDWGMCSAPKIPTALPVAQEGD